MPRKTFTLLPLAALAVAMPAIAHHSTAMFEWGKELPMKNVTVERWDWTNPHTLLYVQAPNGKGGTERWAFEGMSPNHLVRNGWSRKSLKAGDKISLTYYALRDSRKGGFNVSVTLPDGKTIRQLGAPTVNPANDK